MSANVQKTIVTAIAGVLASASTALAADHADTVLHYLDCPGNAWSASWSGDGFQHTLGSSGARHFDTVMHYQTWDHSCWELRWDASRSAFLHRPLTASGAAHYDYILNYIDWSGAHWTAFRTRTGWYHLQR
jgi:hypothetical protein